MSNSSDFITKSEAFDVEILEQCGATSLTYKIQLNGQTCFMKKLRPELRNDNRYRELFYKEYNTGKDIYSPYIVRYLDIRDNADETCIIMEYVNGCSLKEKIDKEPEYFEKEENIKRVLLQLCEALQALHKENVVHLDITPSNIIISQTSGNVKLIDLGFCLSDWSDRTIGTTTKFGAPEATKNRIEEIDARTDIYSIGRLLQYIEEKSGAKFPQYINRIKKRCLQKEKRLRYGNAGEIAQEIKKQKKSKYALAVITIAVMIALAPFATRIYNIIDDYIAWELGEIDDRFCENGIYYRITNHDARTVEVTHKGETPEEYEFEYDDGEITIPATVTHRNRSFRVTSIASGAFDNPETTSIILPEGLECIKDKAFFNCRITGNVHIPSTLTYIGEWVFNANTCIDSFFVDAANPKFDSRNGCNAIIETATNTLVAACANTVIPESVTAIGDDAFVLYQGTTVTIPKNVTRIGKYSFYNSAIKEIILPENVTLIDDYAFNMCQKLQKVVSYIPAQNLQPTGIDSFSGINSECILYVPKGAKAVYENTHGWNSFANIVEME